MRQRFRRRGTVVDRSRDRERNRSLRRLHALAHRGALAKRRERGTVDADSLADARRKLRAARVHVVGIEAAGEERAAAAAGLHG